MIKIDKFINQKMLDKELIRHSLFYNLKPLDDFVKRILVKRGYLEPIDQFGVCRLTLKGGLERKNAENRLNKQKINKETINNGRKKSDEDKWQI